MTPKPLSHDRLQQEFILYVHNKYPETRGTCFHVPNEMRIISKEILISLFISLLRYFKLFIRSEQLEAYCNALDLTPYRIQALSRGKSIGVLPGVLDILWYWNGRLIAIDVKVGKDKLSPSQLSFIAAIEKQGGKAYILSTIEQIPLIAKEVIGH
jgi:hypothetical protein